MRTGLTKALILAAVLLTLPGSGGAQVQDLEPWWPYSPKIRRWQPVSWQTATPQMRTQYPLRAIVILRAEFPDGSIGNCLASFISPTELLTSAHCLFLESDDEKTVAPHKRAWIEIWPELSAQIGRTTFEVVEATVNRGYSAEDHAKPGGPESQQPGRDLAKLRLAESLGSQLGYLGTHRKMIVDGREDSPGQVGSLANTLDIASICDQEGLAGVNEGRWLFMRDIVNFMAKVKIDTDSDPDYEYTPFNLRGLQGLEVCSSHYFKNVDPRSDLPAERLFATQCVFSGIHNSAAVHNCPTEEGDSGAPLYILDADKMPVVFAVHSAHPFDGVSNFGEHNHGKAAFVYGEEPVYLEFPDDTPPLYEGKGDG